MEPIERINIPSNSPFNQKLIDFQELSLDLLDYTRNLSKGPSTDILFGIHRIADKVLIASSECRYAAKKGERLLPAFQNMLTDHRKALTVVMTSFLSEYRLSKIEKNAQIENLAERLLKKITDTYKPELIKSFALTPPKLKAE